MKKEVVEVERKARTCYNQALNEMKGKNKVLLKTQICCSKPLNEMKKVQE